MADRTSELLAEIAANPADDGPRLVYADTLVERGDPRGEFIQIQLRKGAYDGALQDREYQLLRANKERWTAEAGITGALTNFFRGFPASLIGSAAAILGCREALRTQPITSLSILSSFERLDELMQLPELARVRDITLSGVLGDYGRRSPIPHALFEAVVRSPHLTGLRQLTLQEKCLDNHTSVLLAEAAWLPALEELIVDTNELPLDVLAPRLPAVYRLVLSKCRIPESGAHDMAGSMHALRDIYMPENHIRGSGLAALARSPSFARISRLDVSHNGIEDDGAVAIAESPHATGLRSLVLTGNSIGPEGAAALARSPHLSALAHLDLRDNLVGHAGLDALVASTSLCALQRLGISRNQLGTGVYEQYESDEYSGSSEVQLSSAQIAARFGRKIAID